MTGTKLFNTRHVSSSATRDYLRGMGSIMNIRGNTLREYEFSASQGEADRDALFNDWAAVGEDMSCALSRYRRSLG